MDIPASQDDRLAIPFPAAEIRDCVCDRAAVVVKAVKVAIKTSFDIAIP